MILSFNFLVNETKASKLYFVKTIPTDTFLAPPIFYKLFAESIH